jgi:nicotinamidase-related amidase
MTTTALLLIDIQNDYFPDGAMELVGMTEAAEKAGALLKAFRNAGRPVIHVRHLSIEDGATFFLPGTEGCETHSSVAPEPDEPVIEKNFPNGFRDTDLDRVLRTRDISRLVIVGAMSYMCIDATTRAAVDMGYDCIVAHDACAAPNLEFNGAAVPAAEAHAAFMAGLADGYGSVIAADEVEGQLASLDAE